MLAKLCHWVFILINKRDREIKNKFSTYIKIIRVTSAASNRVGKGSVQGSPLVYSNNTIVFELLRPFIHFFKFTSM